MRCTRGRNPRGQGGTGERVPCALDSARRRLRRARASARLVSARRRCSGESEEGEEEREAAGAALPARRRLAGRAKKSAIVLGAVGVGGDGAIGSGLEEFREEAARGFGQQSALKQPRLSLALGVFGNDLFGE